jgi:hypothetical protein
VEHVARTKLFPQLKLACKAVFDVCSSAWEVCIELVELQAEDDADTFCISQKLEAQEQCDTTIEILVEGLSGIFPLVDVVKTAVKFPHLQKTTEGLLNLIEDASRFVVDYKLDGEAGVYFVGSVYMH